MKGIKFMADGKKNFVLQVNGSDSNIVFSSRQPRGAALKAANRGYTSIRLRERGTNRIHVFNGKRIQVESPANRPSWLPAKVWKATVKKSGVERA
jgi:hypothetical protein